MFLYLQYLEMRFSSYVRTYGAAMYMFQMILYTSVAVYAPALALSHGKCVSNHGYLTA